MLRLAVRYRNQVAHFALDDVPTTIGSSDANDFVCRFPGISSQHALVERLGQGARLADAGSKNGLVSDGERQSEVVLGIGDSVQIGRAMATLEEVSSAEHRVGLSFPDSEDESAGTPDTDSASGASTTSGPVAALRFVARLREHADSAERLRELLPTVLGILNGEGLSMVRSGDDGDAIVSATAGTTLDAAELATAAAGRPGVAVELDPDRFLLSTGALADSERLVALLAHEPRQWQVDFLSFLAGWGKTTPRHLLPDRRLPRDQALDVPPGIVLGSSAATEELLGQIRSTVWSDLDVLLTGETGVGKEVFARIIHRSGKTAKGPFVTLNCAAIPAELLEAQLFGVESGVATGVSKRSGLFVAAEGGSILLDEIGELTSHLQAKLLRVLQEREVLPLGGTVPRKVNARVISASNVDLVRATSSGAFRSDLYYRVCGLHFQIPPLRARRDDIPVLVLKFATDAAAGYGKHIQGVSAKALDLLLRHNWPGNVRELRTAVERAVLLCDDGGQLESRHFRVFETQHESPQSAGGPLGTNREGFDSSGGLLQDQVDALERRLIREALITEAGNKTATARRLGISRQGLGLKMKRLFPQESPGSDR